MLCDLHLMYNNYLALLVWEYKKMAGRFITLVNQTVLLYNTLYFNNYGINAM